MIKVINNKQKSTVWFGNLDVGDTFLWNEVLYIKCNDNLGALSLSCGGEYEELGVNEMVLPVDIEIKIKR